MSDNKEKFETWTEEMSVAGGDLMETLKEMMKDASIHRMRVINNRTEKTIVDIPAVAAIPVALVLNIWALVGAAVLYAADFRVIVERRGSSSDSAETGDTDISEEIVIMDDSAPAPSVEEVEVATEKADPTESIVEPDAPAAAEAVVEPDAPTPAEAVERCQGMTKAGTQCKRKPKEGSAYCSSHQPG